MEISQYFTTPSEEVLESIKIPDANQIGYNLMPLADFHSGEGPMPDIAILGVPEDRGGMDNKGSAKSPDEIRKALYQLQNHNNLRMIDLGDLNVGHSLGDTMAALTDVLFQLLSKQIIPVVIGGTNDLAYANFLAYEKLEIVVNLVSVDSEFNIGRGEEEINSKNYLSKILLKQPNYLFNFSNLGYQTYLVGRDEIELLEKLNYDAIRLGLARSDIRHTEPLLRNADMVAFDISAVRRPDAPGNRYASPNGFYGEEMCQLARYAGMSDKLSSVGFYEVNTEADRDNQTAELTAQMIWYFIDGFYNRKGDFPKCNKEEYYKYNINIGHPHQNMVFYKSPKSGRWWMEIPYPSDERLKYDRHLLAPCTYEDYQMAMENELPNRWIHMYKKLI